GAEVPDPGLVDVLEPFQVVEQLARGVLVVGSLAADAERAARLVVVPGDDSTAADGAERVAAGEDAGGLRSTALGVGEHDGPRPREGALHHGPGLTVGPLRLAHLRLDQAEGEL